MAPKYVWAVRNECDHVGMMGCFRDIVQGIQCLTGGADKHVYDLKCFTTSAPVNDWVVDRAMKCTDKYLEEIAAEDKMVASQLTGKICANGITMSLSDFCHSILEIPPLHRSIALGGPQPDEFVLDE
jgi:hypothetical protein